MSYCVFPEKKAVSLVNFDGHSTLRAVSNLLRTSTYVIVALNTKLLKAKRCLKAKTCINIIGTL